MGTNGSGRALSVVLMDFEPALSGSTFHLAVGARLRIAFEVLSIGASALRPSPCPIVCPVYRRVHSPSAGRQTPSVWNGFCPPRPEERAI